jgi:hypothetical protein
VETLFEAGKGQPPWLAICAYAWESEGNSLTVWDDSEKKDVFEGVLKVIFSGLLNYKNLK